MPFDGPLWYIFVLYIFLILFGNGIDCKNPRIFGCLIILISIVFALFHSCVINEILQFPYAFWLERTCRMISPFLVGAYLAREHEPICCSFKSVISRMSIVGSIICILLATYLGDGVITIILMYLCTFLLWIACPNFELKGSSIMRQDTFSIYAVHEGLIVVMLTIIYKLKVSVNGVMDITLIMIVELIFILMIGLLINFCLKKLPPLFDVILSGGRNTKKMRHRK